MIKRCKYCRPKWAYGIKSSTILGRIVETIWPPHILGGDGTGPISDGMCPAAFKREMAIMDRAELKKWEMRWDRWRKYADSRNTMPEYRICWILDYQEARRNEMQGE